MFGNKINNSILRSLKTILFVLFIISLIGCQTTTTVETTYEAQMDSALKECNTLPKIKAEQCAAIIEKRDEIFNHVLSTSTKAIGAAQREIWGERVIENSVNTIQLLVDSEVDVEEVCILRDIGKVDCVQMSTVLAYYDTEMGELIMSDIENLFDVFELNPENEVLIGCGSGVFGSAESWEIVRDSTDTLFDWIGGRKMDTIVELCEGFHQNAAPNIDALAKSGGFSGITGFDTQGMSNLCGFSAHQTTMSDEFTDSALQQIEDMHEKCQMTSWIGDDDFPSYFPDKILISGTKITQNDDGETQTRISVNAEGKVSPPVIEDSTQNSNTTTMTYFDLTTVTITHWDGGVFEGGTTGIKIKDPIEGRTTEYWSIKEDGSGINKKTTHPDGSTENEIVTPGDSRFKDLFPGLKLCSGEGCFEACFNFNLINPKLETDCRNGGYMCAEFSQEAFCCSNPEANPGDPRVVMPDPNGDFMCMGDIDLDTMEETCQRKCMIAEHEDCQAHCMSQESYGGFGYDLTDLLCTEAYAEWCAKSETVDFGVTGFNPLNPFWGPVPLPDPIQSPVIIEHLLIPGSEPGGDYSP